MLTGTETKDSHVEAPPHSTLFLPVSGKSAEKVSLEFTVLKEETVKEYLDSIIENPNLIRKTTEFRFPERISLEDFTRVCLELKKNAPNLRKIIFPNEYFKEDNQNETTYIYSSTILRLLAEFVSGTGIVSVDIHEQIISYAEEQAQAFLKIACQVMQGAARASFDEIIEFWKSFCLDQLAYGKHESAIKVEEVKVLLQYLTLALGELVNDPEKGLFNFFKFVAYPLGSKERLAAILQYLIAFFNARALGNTFSDAAFPFADVVSNMDACVTKSRAEIAYPLLVQYLTKYGCTLPENPFEFQRDIHQALSTYNRKYRAIVARVVAMLEAACPPKMLPFFRVLNGCFEWFVVVNGPVYLQAVAEFYLDDAAKVSREIFNNVIACGEKNTLLHLEEAHAKGLDRDQAAIFFAMVANNKSIISVRIPKMISPSLLTAYAAAIEKNLAIEAVSYGDDSDLKNYMARHTENQIERSAIARIFSAVERNRREKLRYPDLSARLFRTLYRSSEGKSPLREMKFCYPFSQREMLNFLFTLMSGQKSQPKHPMTLVLSDNLITEVALWYLYFKMQINDEPIKQMAALVAQWVEERGVYLGLTALGRCLDFVKTTIERHSFQAFEKDNINHLHRVVCFFIENYARDSDISLEKFTATLVKSDPPISSRINAIAGQIETFFYREAIVVETSAKLAFSDLQIAKSRQSPGEDAAAYSLAELQQNERWHQKFLPRGMFSANAVYLSDAATYLSRCLQKNKERDRACDMEQRRQRFYGFCSAVVQAEEKLNADIARYRKEMGESKLLPEAKRAQSACPSEFTVFLKQLSVNRVRSLQTMVASELKVPFSEEGLSRLTTRAADSGDPFTRHFLMMELFSQQRTSLRPGPAEMREHGAVVCDIASFTQSKPVLAFINHFLRTFIIEKNSLPIKKAALHVLKCCHSDAAPFEERIEKLLLSDPSVIDLAHRIRGGDSPKHNSARDGAKGFFKTWLGKKVAGPPNSLSAVKPGEIFNTNLADIIIDNALFFFRAFCQDRLNKQKLDSEAKDFREAHALLSGKEAAEFLEKTAQSYLFRLGLEPEFVARLFHKAAGTIDVEWVDFVKRTYLAHLFFDFVMEAFLRYLIAIGCALESEDEAGQSVLHYLIHSHCYFSIESLIGHRQGRRVEGQHLLGDAVAAGDLRIVELLLREQAGVAFEITQSERLRALMLTLQTPSRASARELLTRDGLPPLNQTNTHRHSPLMVAAQGSDPDAVRWVLAMGSLKQRQDAVAAGDFRLAVNALGQNGLMCAMIPSKNNVLPLGAFHSTRVVIITKILDSIVADSPLKEARERILQALFYNPDEHYGYVLVDYIIRSLNLPVLQVLVTTYGFDLSRQDGHGFTLLHTLCQLTYASLDSGIKRICSEAQFLKYQCDMVRFVVAKAPRLLLVSRSDNKALSNAEEIKPEKMISQQLEWQDEQGLSPIILALKSAEKAFLTRSREEPMANLIGGRNEIPLFPAIRSQKYELVLALLNQSHEGSEPLGDWKQDGLNIIKKILQHLDKLIIRNHTTQAEGPCALLKALAFDFSQEAGLRKLAYDTLDLFYTKLERMFNHRVRLSSAQFAFYLKDFTGLECLISREEERPSDELSDELRYKWNALHALHDMAVASYKNVFYPTVAGLPIRVGGLFDFFFLGEDLNPIPFDRMDRDLQRYAGVLDMMYRSGLFTPPELWEDSQFYIPNMEAITWPIDRISFEENSPLIAVFSFRLQGKTMGEENIYGGLIKRFFGDDKKNLRAERDYTYDPIFHFYMAELVSNRMNFFHKLEEAFDADQQELMAFCDASHDDVASMVVQLHKCAVLTHSILYRWQIAQYLAQLVKTLFDCKDASDPNRILDNRIRQWLQLAEQAIKDFNLKNCGHALERVLTKHYHRLVTDLETIKQQTTQEASASHQVTLLTLFSDESPKLTSALLSNRSLANSGIRSHSMPRDSSRTAGSGSSKSKSYPSSPNTVALAAESKQTHSPQSEAGSSLSGDSPHTQILSDLAGMPPLCLGSAIPGEGQYPNRRIMKVTAGHPRFLRSSLALYHLSFIKTEHNTPRSGDEEESPNAPKIFKN